MTDLIRAEAFPPFMVKRAYAGTVHYPVETKLGPRIQNELQLVLLHTGSIQVSVDGTPMNIPIGQVCLLKPGHEEQFVFAAKEETWHRWIAVNVPPLSAEMEEALYSLPFHIAISAEMNQLTDLMLSLQRNQGVDQDHVLRSCGQAAILLFMSECRSIEVLTLTHPSVLAVRAFIQNSYHLDLTLKQMAAEGHVSVEHLIRLFHRYENKTPAQYLWNYRIERGLALLRNTGLSVTEIAYQCGFKTSHHFARLVKGHTGLSPSGVRQVTWEVL